MNLTTRPILADILLPQYNRFWDEPAAVDLGWIGLLFSVLCLSTQYQLSAEGLTESDELRSRVQLYHEKTVQCLTLNRLTSGGVHVVETMVIHCISEALLCKDSNIGIWFLLGMLVQLAVNQGYHRDPGNFAHFSPFEGEMRRRVWAAIVQLDLRLSSQTGLARLLKSQQYNTDEPRNLSDSDFDEETLELPPSRSESEVTPVLYCLAKNRIDSVSEAISDLTADTRDHSHSEIMDLDAKLREAEVSLPSVFQWQPIDQSFVLPFQTTVQRITLQLAIQRLTIWLHRKHLAPSQPQMPFRYSKNACVQAAIKIIALQLLIDKQTQPDGPLCTMRQILSLRMQSVFLLGLSILYYYLELVRRMPDQLHDPETNARIYNLLRDTYPIWLRSSMASREARTATEHIRFLLDLADQKTSELQVKHPSIDTSIVQTSGSLPDPMTWNVNQGKNSGCIEDTCYTQIQMNLTLTHPDYASNFPPAFKSGFEASDPSIPTDTLNPFYPLIAHTNPFDYWNEVNCLLSNYTTESTNNGSHGTM